MMIKVIFSYSKSLEETKEKYSTNKKLIINNYYIKNVYF